MARVDLTVADLLDEETARELERKIKRVRGALTVDIDPETGEVDVVTDPGTRADVEDAVEDLGLTIDR